MSIKDLDTWFTHVDFFLAGINKLGNGPSLDVFSFECADHQIVHAGGVSSRKVLYNLQNRSWYRGPVWYYDVDKVIHHIDQYRIEIHFSIRDAKTQSKLHTQCVSWELDKEFIVNPLHQDYKPRREAVDYFTRLGLTLLDAERFFRALSMAALHSTYLNNPQALDYRKPVNKNLLERLLQSIAKLPLTSKEFDSTFDLEHEILTIADQKLDHQSRDPEELGNILVVLTTRSNEMITFRW